MTFSTAIHNHKMYVHLFYIFEANNIFFGKKYNKITTYLVYEFQILTKTKTEKVKS